MTVATSSADPDRLVGFSPAEAASAEPLSAALGRLSIDVAALDATIGFYAPANFAPEECLAVIGEVLAWSSHLASWVAAVGEAFRAAGHDPDGDGVVRVRSRAVGLVGRASLDDQRDWLADQLATIDERVRAGESVGAGRLGRIVAMARELVDAASDPQAEARRLMARLGPADAAAAVRIFSRAAAGASSRHDPAIGALADLGHVVSLGLEGEGSDAARWAERLIEPEVAVGRLPRGLTEALALLGAGNAPGTSTFGTALAVGLLAHGSTAATLGVVLRLYGSTDPLAPLMTTATERGPTGFTQARLANGIVDRLVHADGGRPLCLALSGVDDPDALARSRLLVASVDPSLPEPRRMEVAVALADLYRRAHDGTAEALPGLHPYGPDATAAFGAAMQPLFEHVNVGGDKGGLWVGGEDHGDSGVLWRAVHDLGQDPGGAGGLAAAVAGATTARLAQGYVVPPPGGGSGPPFQPGTLGDLSIIYGRVASAVGQGRIENLVVTVEDDGDRLDEAARSTVFGVVGEAPGGSTLAGVSDALTVLTEPGTSVAPAGSGWSPLAGVGERLTRDLVSFNLLAHPEWATDDVRDALREARRAGPDGVDLLIHDREGRFGEPTPELNALRAAVMAQQQEADLHRASDLVATTSSEGV